MKSTKIEAVLLDSGKVLNSPSSGHWFISLQSAGNYVNSIAIIKTIEEEYEHFTKYYKIFSNALPEPQYSLHPN